MSMEWTKIVGWLLAAGYLLVASGLATALINYLAGDRRADVLAFLEKVLNLPLRARVWIPFALAFFGLAGLLAWLGFGLDPVPKVPFLIVGCLFSLLPLAMVTYSWCVLIGIQMGRQLLPRVDDDEGPGGGPGPSDSPPPTPPGRRAPTRSPGSR